MRITLHPAFILHSRPYRETSLLLDVFTQDYGRISLISRGVRKNRSPLKALLQPFNPLLLSWHGKTELMTLAQTEMNGAPLQLTGACLLSGFYLNELLMRLLPKQDPFSQLYTVYFNTLVELAGNELQEKALRIFEKHLLNELGYGLQLKHILADKFYRYIPEHGFELCEQSNTAMVFSGKSLLAIANEQLDDTDSLKDAKRLMRMVLASLLGTQELQSRKLFF